MGLFAGEGYHLGYMYGRPGMEGKPEKWNGVPLQYRLQFEQNIEFFMELDSNRINTWIFSA